MSVAIIPEIQHQLSCDGVMLGKFTERQLMEIRSAIDFVLQTHCQGINHLVIIEIVCRLSGFGWNQLESDGRPSKLAFVRQVAMALTYERTDMSLADVGGLYGGRDHGTVLHARQVVEQCRKGKDYSDGQRLKFIRSVEQALEQAVAKSAAATTANGSPEHAGMLAMAKAARH